MYVCVYVYAATWENIYYVMLNFKRRIQKLHIDYKYKYKYNLVKIFRGKKHCNANHKNCVVRLWAIHDILPKLPRLLYYLSIQV